MGHFDGGHRSVNQRGLLSALISWLLQTLSPAVNSNHARKWTYSIPIQRFLIGYQGTDGTQPSLISIYQSWGGSGRSESVLGRSFRQDEPNLNLNPDKMRVILLRGSDDLGLGFNLFWLKSPQIYCLRVLLDLPGDSSGLEYFPPILACYIN